MMTPLNYWKCEWCDKMMNDLFLEVAKDRDFILSVITKEEKRWRWDMALQIKEWNCSICGKILTDLLMRGRPRKYCEGCYPPKKT